MAGDTEGAVSMTQRINRLKLKAADTWLIVVLWFYDKALGRFVSSELRQELRDSSSDLLRIRKRRTGCLACSELDYGACTCQEDCGHLVCTGWASRGAANPLGQQPGTGEQP